MQDLYRGEVQGLTQVADLNLAQQQAKIQALQSMAQGANTEQGRMNLLKSTFGNQGANQYTRGLSGLDQLVVSGDQSAREQLIQGTQGQVQGLSQDVQGIQQDVNTQRMAQEQALRGFGSNIQEQINQGLTGIDTDIDTAYQTELERRQALFNPESQEYKQAMQGIQQSLTERQNMLGSGYADLLESLLPQAYSQAGVRQSSAQTTGIENYIQNLRDFEKTGQIAVQRNVPGSNRTETQMLKGKEAQAYLDSGGGMRVTHHKNRAALQKMNDLLAQKLGLDTDLYGTEINRGGAGFAFGENNKRYASSLSDLRNFYKNQYSNLDQESVLKNRLAQMSGGMNYDDFIKGSDISRLETASPEAIQRANILSQMAGGDVKYAPETVKQGDFTQFSDIKDLLTRYGANVTGPRTSK